MTWRLGACVLLAGGCLALLAGCENGSSGSGGASVSFYQQVEQAKKEPSPEVRARQLTRIGWEQARSGNELDAEDTLSLGAKACGEIEDATARAGAYAYLADVQIKLGNKLPGRNALAKAREAIDKIDVQEFKARSWCKVAKVHHALGEAEEAASALKTAEDLAGKLVDAEGAPDQVAQTLVLDVVALAYQEIGQPAEARRVTSAAAEVAGAIADPRQRSKSLVDVAVTEHTMGEKDAAAATFTAALASARKVDSVYNKVIALADIAENLYGCGDKEQAKQVLAEAESGVKQIPEPDWKDQARAEVEKLKGRVQ